MVLGWVVVVAVRRRARCWWPSPPPTARCGPATGPTTGRRRRGSSTPGSGRAPPRSCAPATFERRSEVTGAVITSEDVLAQRPPQRLHRQLGGVDGRDDDRLIVCPAPPTGEAAGRRASSATPAAPPTRRTWPSELAGLRSILQGADAAVRGRGRRRGGLLRAGAAAQRPAGAVRHGGRASASTPPPGAPSNSRVALRGRHRRGGDGHRASATVVTDADLDPEPGARGDGGYGMVPGALRPRIDAVGGSRNPRPVPVLTSGGDDRRSLGQSTHSAITLSGFSAARAPDLGGHGPHVP